MDKKIKLSDLIRDWTQGHKMPLIYHTSYDDRVWIDLDIKGAEQRALFAVQDEGNPPYVVVIPREGAELKYLNPGDPDFFHKMEHIIVEAVSEWISL